MDQYIKVPHQITDKSFEIISDEIKELDPTFQFQTPLQEDIIKRAIHTSADFDYLKNLVFTGKAEILIQEVIKQGGHIITDTNMALAGINKKILDQYGCHYHCFVNDERAFKISKEKGITRSMAAIQLASQLEGPKVYVIGNAPTAIYQILESVEAGKFEIEAVIGVPVGFVGAAESKKALHESEIPSIAALGRKGGSNVAAAIVNAIQYNIKGIIHQH
ncbi:cobalt-precorrin-8 methylmutase [Facklamia sp. DSM 111018]|uniref:Cobalt-precorrin-8 methylmutase n=1 Tax=Facklamia lactis TaxID=2749967 RepID=A0ABS0LNU1_9LACT|nr:cobalt-precorrin-8 methylmutase [Facklamia lactis]MBG9985835.1 cobalt-precorrin-8 methylmutase [Facklamia lactis]